MTSTLEQFVLAGVPLNDEIKLTMEDLRFTPASKKANLVGNNDSDGEVLVREPHYGLSYLEATIRVVPAATSDAGREVLGELTDALQECQREDGGSALVWTPNNSVRSYTGYVLVAEHTEIPITQEGEVAGWFIKAPVVRVKFICSSFWLTPERTVKAVTESGAEPLQVIYVGGIGGDVPAEARLIAKDKATQDRRFAAIGRDTVSSESSPAILLPASTALTATGFAGESKTRSGAYGSEKVFRATAVTQPTPICGTGRISNVGSYAIYVRLYATSEASRFRISYRDGDGVLIPLEWKQPPVVNAFAEVYMGEVFLDEAALGTQTAEIRVEQKAGTEAPANDINYLILWPTGKGSCVARAPSANKPSSLVAYDFFNQSTGNLEGKELPFPAITWAETNKTGENGFKVAKEALEGGSENGIATRAKVSDANLNSGCFAQAGATSYTAFGASLSLPAGCQMRTANTRLGILGRYVSAEKWVMAVLSVATGGGGSPAGVVLRVIKDVSGSVTELGSETTGVSYSQAETLWTLGAATITFNVAANGAWTASCGAASISGQDADLATGGTLASGNVGLYDAHSSASAATRKVDAFELFGIEEPGRVCYSGKQMEFRSDGALRQDSSGSYDGQPPVVRGADFYLEPAGESGRINRIAIRMRRNDVLAEQDANVTDKQSVEVLATERFLLPR